MSPTPAQPASGAPVSVDVCPACRGLWLDAHVIAGLCPTVAGLSDRVVEILLVGRAGDHVAKCPRCAAVPYEFRLMPDFFVDYCPGCAGVWLDDGEYDPAIFTLRPETPPTPRERNPYRAAAEKSEKKREVLCRDCALPVVVAQSFMTDRGLVCARCNAFRETRAYSRRAEAAERGMPVVTLLDLLVTFLAGGSSARR